MDEINMTENEKIINNENVEIKLNIRVEKTTGVIFGQGRYQILDEIEKHGSLKKAAEEIGMSYRAAWGKIKNSEKISGQKLIEKDTNKEGYHLTEFGKMLKNKFHQFNQEIEEYAKEKFNSEFEFLLKK
jgi:molybdate transport system regulatory protein